MIGAGKGLHEKKTHNSGAVYGSRRRSDVYERTPGFFLSSPARCRMYGRLGPFPPGFPDSPGDDDGCVPRISCRGAAAVRTKKFFSDRSHSGQPLRQDVHGDGAGYRGRAKRILSPSGSD